MRVIRHPEVPQELEAAALWYDERQPGLGGDLPRLAGSEQSFSTNQDRVGA
jgi:hypothetical protein